MPRFALPAALRRFAADSRGSISVEAVIVMPLLIWLFMALFVYWDAYRKQNTHVKATYTVADMVSREQSTVTGGFINGLHQIFRYVSNTNEDTWMRVTHIQYDQPNDRHVVLWSSTTNGTRAPILNAATIADLRPRIPNMAHADTLIIVETWANFTPVFQVGLPAQAYYQLTVTRPRFLSPLPFTS